jgi:hypothetical protein
MPLLLVVTCVQMHQAHVSHQNVDACNHRSSQLDTQV